MAARGGGIEDGRIRVGNLRSLADRVGPRGLFLPPAPSNETQRDGFGVEKPDDFLTKTGRNRDPKRRLRPFCSAGKKGS